jgi:hypothetical protein
MGKSSKSTVARNSTSVKSSAPPITNKGPNTSAATRTTKASGKNKKKY